MGAPCGPGATITTYPLPACKSTTRRLVHCNRSAMPTPVRHVRWCGVRGSVATTTHCGSEAANA